MVQDGGTIPFLLGSNDQAAYSIIPQTDERTVRIGPANSPRGTVPFLPSHKWQKCIGRKAANAPPYDHIKQPIPSEQQQKLQLQVKRAAVHKVIMELPNLHSETKAGLRSYLDNRLDKSPEATPEPITRGQRSIATLQHQATLRKDPAQAHIAVRSATFEACRRLPSVQRYQTARRDATTPPEVLQVLSSVASKDILNEYNPQTSAPAPLTVHEAALLQDSL